ncbi:hypothetical protein QJQ45_021231 [Haematococcus lacustris]|nr:hypothetical protein QJQ45_021231 [Haematococcus lacustris]
MTVKNTHIRAPLNWLAPAKGNLAHDVSWYADSLAASLAAPPDKVRRLLRRYPASLALPRQQLVSCVAALLQLVPSLGPLPALCMLLKKPQLLMLPPQELGKRLAATAAAFGMAQADAAPLIAKQPGLLEVEEDSLAQQIAVPSLLPVLTRLGPSSLRLLLATPLESIQDQVSELRSLAERYLPSHRVSESKLLLTSWPQLLLTPLKDVGVVMQRLPVLLHIPPKALLDSLLRCPGILCLPPPQLLSHHKALGMALGLDGAQLGSVLVRELRLLQLDPGVVRMRVEALMGCLYLPRATVLGMLVAQPQLLLYTPITLHEHLTAMKQLLRVPHAVATAMVAAHPSLLTRSPSAQQAQVTSLSRVLRLPPLRVVDLVLRAPRLLTFSTLRLIASRDYLMQLMGVPLGNMGHVVSRWPDLVVETPDTVHSKVLEVAAVLGLAPAQAGDVVCRNPRLLAQDPRLWQTNLDTLISSLRVPRSVARDAVVARPAILSRPPAELYAVCQQWPPLLASSPDWQAQLEAAGKRGVEVCERLGCDPDVMARLKYVAGCGLQRYCNMLDEQLLSDKRAFERLSKKLLQHLQELNASPKAVFKCCLRGLKPQMDKAQDDDMELRAQVAGLHQQLSDATASYQQVQADMEQLQAAQQELQGENESLEQLAEERTHAIQLLQQDKHRLSLALRNIRRYRSIGPRLTWHQRQLMNILMRHRVSPEVLQRCAEGGYGIPLGSAAQQPCQAPDPPALTANFIPTQVGRRGKPVARPAAYLAQHYLSTARLVLQTQVSRRKLGICRELFVNEQCQVPNPHRPGQRTTVRRQLRVVAKYLKSKTLGEEQDPW